MGATESLPYDGDTHIDANSVPIGLPHATTANSSSPVPTKAYPVSQQENNGDSRHHRQRKNPPRRRPPLQSKPIKRMEGLVLGGPKTGKRTLLSRLKGIDPFATIEKKGKSDSEAKEENPSITIQYKPPSESPTWDRIKLRIRYSNSIDDSVKAEQKEKNPEQNDFVVVLINPKDEEELTHSHLEVLLTSYLDRLGYGAVAGAESDAEGREREVAIAENNANGSLPFCIAMLFNFRDLHQEQEDNLASAKVNLERLVHDTLSSRNVPTQKIVVELLETSLLNCYGLDGLHRFIYRTYLQRSQTDLERQLNLVRNQMKLTNNSTEDVTVKPKSMTYEEFLKEITPKEPSQLSRPASDTTGKYDDSGESVPGRINRRQITPTAMLPMGKDALEAFLASSSDEEETKKRHPPNRRSSNTVTSSSSSSSSDSDDDSDDDFFYDESGNRHNHSPVKNAGRADERNNPDGNKDDDDDSSSPDDNDNEEEAKFQESPSSPEVSAEHPEKVDQESREPNTKQQTVTREEEENQIDQIEYDTVRKEEGKEVSVHEKEDVLIDKKDKMEDCIDESEKEEGYVIDDSVSNEHEMKHEEQVNLDEIHDVAQENSGEGNGRTGYLDSDVSYAADDKTGDRKSVMNFDADDVTNGNNQTDYFVGATSPHNNVHEDDNKDEHNYVINSTGLLHEGGQNSPLVLGKFVEGDGGNVMEDNDDDRTSSNSSAEKITRDDDKDHGDDNIITHSRIRENVSDIDMNDDDDEDGFMIGSAPAAENEDNVIGSTSLPVQDDDEESNDDHIVTSSAVAEKIIYGSHDDSDNDDQMIGQTPSISAIVQNNEEEDDDDDYMFTSSTFVGKMGDDEDDEDDGDDGFMISPVSVVQRGEGNNTNDNDNDENDEFMMGNAFINKDDIKAGNEGLQTHSKIAAADGDDEDDNSAQSLANAALSNRNSVEKSSFVSVVENEKNENISLKKNLSLQSQESSRSPSVKNTASISTPPKSAASGGISNAALAAIAQAQQEAEAMMRQQQLQRQQQNSQVGTSPIKEKKAKKKKKDEKKKDEKKKKKKKTKGSGD